MNDSTVYFFLVLFWLPISFITAQDSDVLMTNSRKIKDNRYKDIRGTPYLFEDWQQGKVINTNAEIIDNLLINYNGKTKTFEVKKDDQFIELDPIYYIRIHLKGEGEDIVFQKSFLPRLKNKFVRIIYKDKEMSIIQDFEAQIITKVINNVGKKEEFKSFYHKKQYYLVRNKKVTPFKLKKKSILSNLGHRSELEQFSKKEKLKLSSEKDLLKLMTFYNKITS